MLNEIKKSIETKYKIHTEIVRDSPIVDPKYNYDKLYYPADTITKSSVYTRWLNEHEILRTQMTSCIPKILPNIKEDVILMCPGIVYRRDVVDKTHVGEPHQMDIWLVSKSKKYTREDLLEIVSCVVNAVLPDVKWRYNETSHYYTKDGIEVEILVNNKWLEILECGLILPKLLDDSGLNSDEWSGLALGIGLDRSVMIRKQIDDIRILRSENPNISKQMLDLKKYKQVSKYQKVKRDLSIATYIDSDIEIIGDDIRHIMCDNVSKIEEIIQVSETSYEQLPKHVSERLGMDDSMKNILLRITLCSLEYQISSEEANDIYNKIYSNIHKGSVGYI